LTDSKSQPTIGRTVSPRADDDVISRAVDRGANATAHTYADLYDSDLDRVADALDGLGG
jgi:hypothetical protein